MSEDEVRSGSPSLTYLDPKSMICSANFINALFYLTEENIILMPIQVSFWEDWRCPDQWRREEGTELLDLKLEERNPRQSKIPRELREVPTAREGEGQKEIPEISRDPHQQQGKSSFYFWAWKEFWGIKSQMKYDFFWLKGVGWATFTVSISLAEKSFYRPFLVFGLIYNCLNLRNCHWSFSYVNVFCC